MTQIPPRDRPADDEIEVTKEMIEAGIEAFAGYDDATAGLDDYLPDVYRAMRAAAPEPFREEGAD
jgi:hypothetical protein